MKTVKEKKDVKTKNLVINAIGVMLLLTVVSVVGFLFSIIPVSMMADTEYQETERNIYGVWHNRYMEEYTNGKIRSTDEVNRYYYKVKSGSTYSDSWASYDVSDFTIIDDKEQESVKIERLRYKSELLQKLYKEPYKEDAVIVHFYIHKSTARDIGIQVK